MGWLGGVAKVIGGGKGAPKRENGAGGPWCAWEGYGDALGASVGKPRTAAGAEGGLSATEGGWSATLIEGEGVSCAGRPPDLPAARA